jgi:hypothetical protein
MQKILVILQLYNWNPITLVLIWKVLRQAFRWYHCFWNPSTFGQVISLFEISTAASQLGLLLAPHPLHTAPSTAAPQLGLLLAPHPLHTALSTAAPQLGLLLAPHPLHTAPSTAAPQLKLMKFQREAEFMHVPPDLTTATLYKYMVLRLLFPLQNKIIYLPNMDNWLMGWLCHHEE